jgi:hypothetical protein
MSSSHPRDVIGDRFTKTVVLGVAVSSYPQVVPTVVRVRQSSNWRTLLPWTTAEF